MKVLVSVDVETTNQGEAIGLVSQLMRKVEWPDEVNTVEVGEMEEVESGTVS